MVSRKQNKLNMLVSFFSQTFKLNRKKLGMAMKQFKLNVMILLLSENCCNQGEQVLFY